MRVPIVQAGVVAVLRVILRRFTSKPLVSVVSRPEVETVDTMPWTDNCCPLEIEHRVGFATAA